MARPIIIVLPTMQITAPVVEDKVKVERPKTTVTPLATVPHRGRPLGSHNKPKTAPPA